MGGIKRVLRRYYQDAIKDTKKDAMKDAKIEWHLLGLAQSKVSG